MDFFKKGLSKMKGRMTAAELEKKINEATVNEMGLPSISLLNEISSRSDELEESKVISKYCIITGLNLFLSTSFLFICPPTRLL